METIKTDPEASRAPIAILGVPFDNVTLDDALAIVGGMITRRSPQYATVAGVEFLAESLDDVELRRILFDAHLVIAEDKTVIWASKMLGNELPGSVIQHFIPRLLDEAGQKGWRVFFLGMDDAAAMKLGARHPKLQVAGAYLPTDKPLLEMDHAEILRRVREAKPDILFVTLGSPKQEKWINMNYREAGVPFVFGAGVAYDFAGGSSTLKKAGGKKFWKFMRGVGRQWHRLRARKKSVPLPAEGMVIPDPLGNLVIRAPARLGAAEAQVFGAEWQRAVENSNVMFDLAQTAFIDSTGVGILIRLRRRSRELGYQFFLIAPSATVAAALKMMKLEDFFTIQASMSGVRILMESSANAAPVSSGVTAEELQIRWSGEVTVLNAVELGAFTESELAQVTAGMTVVIDLSRVTFVDSTGIGLMVRFKKNLKRKDVNLKFINATGPVRNVIRQTQLEEFLMGGKV